MTAELEERQVAGGGTGGTSPWRSLLCFLTGATACLLLGGFLFWTGLALTGLDEKRHIPGHWLYHSFWMLPGLVQLVYVVPALRLGARRGAVALRRGIVVGAALVVLGNAGVLWIGYVLSRMD